LAVAVRPVLRELRRTPGVRFHRGLRSREVDALERRAGVRLPAAHRDVLAATNGIEAAGDFVRLFGARPVAVVDLGEWNSLELWKFAWTDEVHECFFFAQTALGDQFGYRLGEVQQAGADPPVITTSLDDPRPRLLDRTFGDWLRRFAELARRPSPVAALGKVGAHELVVRTPSLLISGDPTEGELKPMESVIAMVLSGDVWTQVAAAEPGQVLERVESYLDQNGRARLRLVWA
jgi:hypothetical protein